MDSFGLRRQVLGSCEHGNEMSSLEFGVCHYEVLAAQEGLCFVEQRK
jgi:hypothetical protein